LSLNELIIKMLPFKVSNLMHQSSCNGNLNNNVEVNLSMIQGQHLGLRCSP
jgi:hypothetical protein